MTETDFILGSIVVVLGCFVVAVYSLFIFRGRSSDIYDREEQEILNDAFDKEKHINDINLHI